MLGNFTYHNPTKLIFGTDAMGALATELRNYGPTVQLIYGGGSIKRNGIYDQVMAALEAAGKTVVEDAGVMPNPTVEKLREGVALARENHVDFLLAVGGGSCVDYAKAVAVSANLPADVDPWQTYWVDFDEPAADLDVLPVGSVLTMVGHRLGDELRLGDYQPRGQDEGGPRLRRRPRVPQVRRAQSRVHLHAAEVPDGGRHL